MVNSLFIYAELVPIYWPQQSYNPVRYGHLTCFCTKCKRKSCSCK